MAYVYEHLQKDTGVVFYVGKGTGIRAHQMGDRNRSQFWHRVAKKHGAVVRIVADGLDDELAFLAEQELIDKHRRIGLRLVNMTAGGDGCPLSADAIEKRTQAVRAALKRPEVRAKMSSSMRARLADPEARAEHVRRATAGHASAEVRQKISERTMAGFTPEVRAELSRKLCERWATPEGRAAMTKPTKPKKDDAARKAEAFANRSRATRLRMADLDVREKQVEGMLAANKARMRAVRCVETGAVYPCASEAAAAVGKPPEAGANIKACCNGRIPSAYGHAWRWAESQTAAGQ